MVQSVRLTNYGGARFNRFAGTIKARKITLVALADRNPRERWLTLLARAADVHLPPAPTRIKKFVLPRNRK